MEIVIDFLRYSRIISSFHTYVLFGLEIALETTQLYPTKPFTILFHNWLHRTIIAIL